MINRILSFVNFHFPTYKTEFYPDNFIKACLVYQFLYVKYFTQKLDLNQIIYRLSDYKHSCRSNSPILSNHLRAAVCKYRELAVKWKFRNSSYSVRKNPLVKRFRKSQSKFLKSFLFRENRQKVKSCPTPYSRRSKTFELDHFQSPREERRFEETSSSLAGK